MRRRVNARHPAGAISRVLPPWTHSAAARRTGHTLGQRVEIFVAAALHSSAGARQSLTSGGRSGDWTGLT